MTITAAEIVTEDERVVLEDLDTDLPCDAPKPCPHPAKWIMWTKRHCEKTTGRTLLVCELHHQKVLDGLAGRCPADNEVAIIRDYVTRWELIERKA